MSPALVEVVLRRTGETKKHRALCSVEAKGLQTGAEQEHWHENRKSTGWNWKFYSKEERGGGHPLKHVQDANFESHVACLAVAAVLSRYQHSGILFNLFVICNEHSYPVQMFLPHCPLETHRFPSETRRIRKCSAGVNTEIVYFLLLFSSQGHSSRDRSVTATASWYVAHVLHKAVPMKFFFLLFQSYWPVNLHLR